MSSTDPYQTPSSPKSPESPYPFKQGLTAILFSFRGRIPQRTYWTWVLLPAVNAVMVMGLLMPWLMTPALRADAPSVHQSGLTPLGSIVIPALLIPLVWLSFALGVKRWHDRGKSGWWSLVSLIPFTGAIWTFVECGCLRGSAGTNVYGPDPI